jgi:hypothetical protein
MNSGFLEMKNPNAKTAMLVNTAVSNTRSADTSAAAYCVMVFIQNSNILPKAKIISRL